MHRLIAAALALGLLLGLSPAAVRAEMTPGIFLDGYPLDFDVAPTILNDRTLVPFRAIAEALGVTVTWHGDTRTIDAVGLGHRVRLAISDSDMHVDGAVVALDVPPLIINDRTLVPLRAFSTAFGAEVDWDGVNRIALLYSPPRAMRKLGFYAIRSYNERAYVSHFSDMAYGWATLTADGQVDFTGDPIYRWPEPAGEVTGERLLADAKKAGVRRHLMVRRSDVDDKLTALVTNSDLVDRAAGNIVRAVNEKGFDGVVLDLEGLGYQKEGEEIRAIQQGFTRLVANVAAALHAVGKEVIVSVHPLNGWYPGYDYKALAAEADLLQIMAHDYVQDGNPEPMPKVDEAIRMALGAVGKEQSHKLLLGLSLWDQGLSETPETIPQKAGLAKRYDLAGISIWRMGVIGPERMGALDASVTRQ